MPRTLLRKFVPVTAIVLLVTVGGSGDRGDSGARGVDRFGGVLPRLGSRRVGHPRRDHVVGEGNPDGAISNNFVRRYGVDGGAQWTVGIQPRTGYLQLVDVAATEDAAYVLGSMRSDRGNDVLVAKVDPHGGVGWTARLGTTASDSGSSPVRHHRGDLRGGLHARCLRGPDVPGGTDAFVARLDTTATSCGPSSSGRRAPTGRTPSGRATERGVRRGSDLRGAERRRARRRRGRLRPEVRHRRERDLDEAARDDGRGLRVRAGRRRAGRRRRGSDRRRDAGRPISGATDAFLTLLSSEAIESGRISSAVRRRTPPRPWPSMARRSSSAARRLRISAVSRTAGPPMPPCGRSTPAGPRPTSSGSGPRPAT